MLFFDGGGVLATQFRARLLSVLAVRIAAEQLLQSITAVGLVAKIVLVDLADG